MLKPFNHCYAFSGRDIAIKIFVVQSHFIKFTRQQAEMTNACSDPEKV